MSNPIMKGNFADHDFCRELCTDKLRFDADGNIRCVIPTMEGVSL